MLTGPRPGLRGGVCSCGWSANLGTPLCPVVGPRLVHFGLRRLTGCVTSEVRPVHDQGRSRGRAQHTPQDRRVLVTRFTLSL